MPDPLLEARHPPALLLRELEVPASEIGEIPQTMLEKFEKHVWPTAFNITRAGAWDRKMVWDPWL
jgi:hypothetical protein